MILAVDFVAWVPIMVGIMAILAALITERGVLKGQNEKIQEVHVLVNQRLTDALKVGEILAGQLHDNGITPTIKPGNIMEGRPSTIAEDLKSGLKTGLKDSIKKPKE